MQPISRMSCLPQLHEEVQTVGGPVSAARVLAAMLMALIVSASCAARQEQEPPTAEVHVAQQSTPTATSTALPTATSKPPVTEVPTSQRPNVALFGTPRASAGEESILLATDGNPETIWSSQNHPAQWIAVALDDLYLVDRIDLVVAQAPAGPTTHVLWLDTGSGVRTLFKQLTDFHTEDGQTIAIELDPPRPLKEILVQTLDSPSWVAWRELKVFGVPLITQAGKEAPSRMHLENFLDEVVLPVQVTHAGDGSGRIFVVEQHGRIRVVQNGASNDTLFLDISTQVSCCEERGLINIAFPPSFSASQQFYLSYTNLEGDTNISRFTTTDDPDIADPTSEEILFTVSQPHEAHNGGRLAFGPLDGYLYVGMGDGGSEGRPAHFPQDPQLLLGKILRIDVESGDVPYGIPATNPFVGNDEFRDEIWALGLRNPWGFAFDGHSGDFYVPDTGHNDREELNVQPATSGGGENYGWPTIEGTRCPKIEGLPYPCSKAGIFDPPVAEYDHTRGCAIVGGVFYRGSEFPQLRDRFLFADFCRGDIWSLQRLDSLVATGSSQESHGGWHSELILKASLPVSSIGTDEDGNLYVTGYADGTVYLITQE